MFTDIFLVVMLETAKTIGMKQDKNNHNFSITHTVGLVTMSGLFILNHIFFLLQCKFLAKIISHTINLCSFRLWKHGGNRLNIIIQHYKFNTFIAMLLIISEIYLLLFRAHVKIKRFWGTTENAVRIQISVAIIAYCLVAIVQHDMQLKRSTYEVLQILSISQTDKTNLRNVR